MNCHACGVPLAPEARYCAKCGAKVDAARPGDWRVGLPWAVAGAAVGALIVVLALRVGGRSEGGGSANAPAALDAGAGPGEGVGPGPAPGRPPDISQMSPIERATRLYNRVMSLHAAGKPDSAAFFLPMALQAYALLPELDADSRYHLGVLNLTAGQAAAALAQADTIARGDPTHLFASMLRARAFELQGNVAGARRAYGDFLAHEAAERARQRPEYADHAENLTAFHAQAVAATGGRRGS